MLKKWFEFKKFISSQSVDYLDLLDGDIPPGLYLYCNPRNFDTLRKFKSYNNVYYRLGENFSQKILDALKLRNSAVGLRQSFDFSSLAEPILRTCEINDFQVLFLGATEKEIDLFSAKIDAVFPALKANYQHGYGSIEGYINLVAKLQPDVVILGLGNVKQEKLGYLLKELEGNSLKIFTCGGFIGQEGRELRMFYPEFFTKYNIRFLYRFMTQPHTLWRVLRYYPTFGLKCLFLKLLR